MELRTPRLRLRPYRIEDVDALHALWTDPGVRRYLWDDVTIERERAAEAVGSSVADWAARRYGQWVIAEPTTDSLMGFCGFRPADWSEDAELLVGLYPRHWGQGLA